MTIHELETRRNELRAQLEQYKDLAGHRSYKLVERELGRVRDSIKQHYKQHGRGTNNTKQV